MARYFTTKQKRSALILAYPDDEEWGRKVDKMPDMQVYAIFEKLRKDGMINVNPDGSLSFRSKEEVDELKKRREIVHDKYYHQITLEEYFGGNNG